MEPRLRPLNAVLGLCGLGGLPGGSGTPLLNAGFRVARLEAPIASPPSSTVVIDLLLIHEVESHLVACESKSGGNIEARQAMAYSSLNAANVVRSASVNLGRRVRSPSISSIYACTLEHRERIELGLAKNGTPMGVLAVGDDVITVHGRKFMHPVLSDALSADTINLPYGVARVIAYDPDSPTEIIADVVRAALVGHLAKRTDQRLLQSLAEEVLPMLGFYGKRAIEAFRKKVEVVVRAEATAHPNIYLLVHTTGNSPGMVQFLRTPEDYDTRGRTQSYRSLQRAGRRPQVADSAQLDLLAELQKGDTVGAGTDQ